MIPTLKKSALIFSAILAFTFVSLAEDIIVPPPFGCPPTPTLSQEEIENKIFEQGTIEQMPEFPGGHQALMNFINENRIYPAEAKENRIQGRVIVQFVVEKTGEISTIQVIRGVSPALDKEAIRVVEAMPNWIPGEQNGEKVRVRFFIPVVFRLQ